MRTKGRHVLSRFLEGAGAGVLLVVVCLVCWGVIDALLWATATFGLVIGVGVACALAVLAIGIINVATHT